MVSKSTFVYKMVDSLEIQLYIYTRVADLASERYKNNTPVVLYFHGGGLVAHDRRLLPPHFVQSALGRGWPLISADYRLFPQGNGLDILEDIKDAYKFILERLPGILNAGRGPMKNVIVTGCSAGAWIAYPLGHYAQPRPLALLPYYDHGTSDDDWFRSNKILFKLRIILEQIEHFLTEPVHCGFTSPASQFDQKCLLEDLSPNQVWKKPEEETGGQIPRDMLSCYFYQNNRYPALGMGVDKSFSDPAWKDFPPTIIVHGDTDRLVPLRVSEEAVSVIGPTPAKLFVVPGGVHGFDSRLFLGDPGLAVAEEAWKALDEVVKERAAK